MVPTPSELSLLYPKWRHQQEDSILWLHEQGWLTLPTLSQRKVKVLEAPTGSGKTGIILGAAKMHIDAAEEDGERVRWLILCSTKIEQDQYMSSVGLEYPIASIRGKNNYHCLHDSPYAKVGPCRDPSCGDTHADEAPCSLSLHCDGDVHLTGEPCVSAVIRSSNCPANQPILCPYFSDLHHAISKQVVVTNYAYGLSMLNYAPETFGKFDVIVCDEAHGLDGDLENL